MTNRFIHIIFRQCMFLALLATLFGCSDKKYLDVRNLEIEKQIEKFYFSKSKIMMIDETHGARIETVCILESYEADIADAGIIHDEMNNFLKSVFFVGDEDHWHIVIKSKDAISIVRLNQKSVPLFAPKIKFSGNKNCSQNAKGLILLKIVNSVTGQSNITTGN